MTPPFVRDDGSIAAEPAAGFAAVLREATKRVHREAERCGFVADLVRGRATRNGYAVYLRNLEPVYGALEQGLDAHLQSAPRAVAAFADLRLRRQPALRRDLAAIAGDHWATTLPLLPEAAAYAGAIADAAQSDGLRLAAHGYARYLGDLSGGQILQPLLARTLGLGPAALGLYDFAAFSDLDLPRTALRDALDSLPPAGADADAFVAEALAAFQHNIAVSMAVSAATATAAS